MHLRGMRAGLAQNLRVFLCTDLGIMRGVLLVVFAAGRLGCWWAGLLVGFAAGRLAVNTTIFVTLYDIIYIYRNIIRLARFCFLARILARTCALLHSGEQPELCTAVLYNFSFKDL